jgi:hypothetical protein
MNPQFIQKTARGAKNIPTQPPQQAATTILAGYQVE